jgi:prepilin-type N-terminal cleavage/methylation domain-containing protein
MTKFKLRLSKGFSLLEMLLVLVVMSSIILLITNYGTHRMDQYRIDRASAQMQQILNAGLSYYVTNNTWPSNIAALSEYLPSGGLTSPYGSAYTVGNAGTNGSIFTVAVTMPAGKTNDAIVLAGELPVAAIDSTGLIVTAQVVLPPQTLNSARGVNFAAVYHTGSCVPVPVCPSGFTAQIIVVPAGVNGVFDAPTKSDGSTCSTSTIYNSTTGAPTTTGDCTTINSYPITNFSAFTTGPASSGNPTNCDGTAGRSCYSDASAGSWSTYSSNAWRVCLTVQTEKGTPPIPTANVGSGNGPTLFWAQAEGYVFAFTRCAPNSESTGSSLNVWSN